MTEDPVDVQAILQARTQSTRLRNKIFQPVGGRPLLGWALYRLRQAKRVDRIVIATSSNPKDDTVEAFAADESIACVRGSEEDVLARFAQTARRYPARTIVRATGDNPLLDPEGVDTLITAFKSADADYCGFEGVVPPGTGAEVFSTASLMEADAESTGQAYREHVTSYIYSHPDRFKVGRTAPPDYLAGRSYRLTVDTEADLKLVELICETLAQKNMDFKAKNAVALLDADPGLLKINMDVKQKDWRSQL